MPDDSRDLTNACHLGPSYYQTRLKMLGITDQQNQIEVSISADDYIKKPVQIFQPDQKGIRIIYPDLDGALYTFDTGTKNHPHKVFYRIRLSDPVVHKDGTVQKYSQPAESGSRPFFPPAILQKYNAREKVPVLFLIEGEFKAFKGSMHGLDIVGLASIHGFYSSDGKKAIHDDIIRLVKACQVEKLVLITDADTLVIQWQDGKDLFKRQNSFYTAVKNFREAADMLISDKEIPLKDCYFGHIQEKFHQDGKGLDDLLISQGQDKAAAILDDLKRLQFAEHFFKMINISDQNLSGLFKYFGLANESIFYDKYGHYIGAKEFTFRSKRFQFDGDKVTYVRHEDADEYLRIGDQYMKLVKVPNRHKEPEELLRKWKVSEISRDYKRYPDFIDQVRKYNAFCNIPDNTSAYKRDHYNCYNIYHPLKWDLQPGTIDHTLAFLKHLFGGKATFDKNILGDQFTVALDYLTILFQHPTQILPVPCLVSPENNTGKTTFLKWLKDIYGANATILGNEQFKMSFNSHYITKFLIMIDEGFIDVDKKTEKERLKKLATDDRQFLEFKGMDVQEIDFFGKVIICSNDADKLMKIEEGEIRWFIVKVPTFEKEIPNFRANLKSEIPAFLHFLKHRQICHPNESRAWFNPKYLETDQLKKIISSTRNRLDKIVDEWIKDHFLTYRIDPIRIHHGYLLDQINKMAKYKIDTADLAAYLKDKKGLKVEETKRYRLATGFEEDPATGQITIRYEQFTQRPYTFHAAEWLNDDELTEFNSEFNPALEVDLMLDKMGQARESKIHQNGSSKNANTDQNPDIPF